MRQTLSKSIKWLVASRPLFILAILVSSTLSIAQNDSTSCLSASGEAAVKACHDALKQTPNDVTIRLTLCDALLNLRRHKEAIDLLKAGLAQTPGDSRMEKKLAFVQSDLEEQRWIEKRRSQQISADSKLDTTAKLNRIRCTKLKGETALKACDAALQVLADDPELHRARADALLAIQRNAEAVLAYQRSLRLNPQNSETSTKLLAAEEKRKSKVKECQRQDGAAGLKACDTALLGGAADELSIHIRRGELLQGLDKIPQAIDAYHTALQIEPNNREVSQKIALLTSTQKATEEQSSIVPAPEPKKAEIPKKIAKPSESKQKTDPSSSSSNAENPLAHSPLRENEQLKNQTTPPVVKPPPVKQQPRLYSNKPMVAEVTH